MTLGYKYIPLSKKNEKGVEPLADFNELYYSIKEIVKNSINANNFLDLKVGIVESVKPLKVRINQKLLLESYFLKVPKELKEYETEITIRGKREKVIIHNSLKVGEYVYMLKYQEGQKYLIVGRV